MNRRFIVLLGLSLLIPEFGCGEDAVHVIRQGETVYSIARSYGVSAQAVLSLNGISDPRTIQPGYRLRIPVPGKAAPAAVPGYGEYRVEKNDTLYGIARRYGISLAELLEMNGFSPAYVLKAGEKIRIPGSAAPVQQVPGGNRAAGENPVPALAAGEKPRESGASGVSPGNKGSPAGLSVHWPVSAKEVSYIKGKLYGVQVTGERREPVKSLTRGTVVSAGPYRGFGRVAIVQMTGGYLYVYGGCESLSVKEGDKVVPGTELGKLGIDVKSEKPQLFFFVYRSNNPIDPATAPRA